MSSPFFNDLFSLPQSSDSETIDGLPVVRLPEDAEVLNGLLTMLYPIPPKMPSSYDKVLALLVASQKYDMVGIQSYIRTEIRSRDLLTQTGAVAFRAYALSSSGRLLSEMVTSARLTLNFPMTFEYLCDELPLFEGWALRDLLRFRNRCRDNLISCLESVLNHHRDHSSLNVWIPCSKTASSTSTTTARYLPAWLSDLFKRLITELHQAFTKPLLNPSSFHEEYLIALQAHLTSYNFCVSCAKIHTLKGEAFRKEIVDRLALALDKVSTIFNSPTTFGGSSIRCI
jgi:hypothetical protein